MKKLLLLAVLATGIATASAQTPRSTGKSGSAATRASSTNRDSPASTSTAVTPNYSLGNGQKAGKKTNTAPATGATRASRSSSAPQTAGQRKPTGSGNIESVNKKETPRPKN